MGDVTDTHWLMTSYTQDEAEDPKKKANPKGNGKMEGDGGWLVGDETCKFDTNCAWTWMSIWHLKFLVRKNRGGFFVLECQNCMIHVTTCNPADRQWRILNKLESTKQTSNVNKVKRWLPSVWLPWSYTSLTASTDLQDKNKAPADPPKAPIGPISLWESCRKRHIFRRQFLERVFSGVFRWIFAVFEMFENTTGAGASLWRWCSTTHYPHRAEPRNHVGNHFFWGEWWLAMLIPKLVFCSTWHICIVIYVYNLCT